MTWIARVDEFAREHDPSFSPPWWEVVRNDNGRMTAIAYGLGEPEARLIAAAPRLLAALKVIVACEGGYWHPERYAHERKEALEEARSAIAGALP